MARQEIIDRFLDTSVWLFGPVQIRTDGIVSAKFRSNRVSALLAYLALHPTGDVSREELADQLWPNLDSQAARNNLRVTLQHLKKALEVHGLAGAIETAERTRISLDRRRVRSDVDLLHDLISAVRSEKNDDSRLMLLKRAAAVAKGPLGQDLYDEWIELKRAEASDQRLWVLCKLSRELLASDPQGALQVARKAIAENPYLEEPRELAAAALLALGEPTAATAELRGFEQLLKEQMGQPPSKRLRELQLRIEGQPEVQEQTSPRLIGTIPYGLTRFFGRARELRHIQEWFSEPSQRLLTLYGPGGIGKTRLAAESVGSMSREWRVVWVNGESATTGEALLEQIARTLSPHRPASGNVLDNLALTLQGSPTVLILDNIEQVADSEVGILGELLRAAPKLKLLATSRKTLGIPGERLLRIDPLPTEAAESPGFQLFLDRARASRPDFEDRAENNDQLHHLCAKLEGIPLAIELAAARLTALSVEDLVQDMNKSLDVLVAKRASDRRHQALRATLQWSLTNLDDEWREDFLALSVLRGPWTRDFAAAVAGHGKPSSWLGLMIEVACDHSLLLASWSPDGTRYRMLEMMRAFALEQLGESEQIRLNEELLSFIKRFAPSVTSYAEMNGAWANIENALEFACRAGDVASIVAVARPLLPLLMETSAGRTVLRLLEAAGESRGETLAGAKFIASALLLSLSRFHDAIDAATVGLNALGDASSPVRAGLLAIRSRAKVVTGAVAAAEADALEALQCSRAFGPEVQVHPLLALGKVLYARHDDAAIAYVSEALDISRALGDKVFETDVLDTLGCLQSRAGDVEAAERSFLAIADLDDESVPITRRARVWSRLAQVALKKVDLDLARSRYEAALGLARKAEDHWTIAQALAQLGDAYQMRGESELALKAHEEAVAMRTLTGEKLGLATALRGYARAAFQLERYDDAQAALETASTIGAEVGDVRFLTTVRLLEARVFAALERADDAGRAASEALATIQERQLTLESLDVWHAQEDILFAQGISREQHC